jgi:hypothetical protein
LLISLPFRLLERHDGQYANAPDADRYLNRKKATFLGGGLRAVPSPSKALPVP